MVLCFDLLLWKSSLYFQSTNLASKMFVANILRGKMGTISQVEIAPPYLSLSCQPTDKTTKALAVGPVRQRRAAPRDGRLVTSPRKIGGQTCSSWCPLCPPSGALGRGPPVGAQMGPQVVSVWFQWVKCSLLLHAAPKRGHRQGPGRASLLPCEHMYFSADNGSTGL